MTDVEVICLLLCYFFFQAEDGIRDLVRSRGLGDVYKRQIHRWVGMILQMQSLARFILSQIRCSQVLRVHYKCCLLYTSDAADERSSVDLGGRRIIKKKTSKEVGGGLSIL